MFARTVQTNLVTENYNSLSVVEPELSWIEKKRVARYMDKHLTTRSPDHSSSRHGKTPLSRER
jgi:hypothetical protein